MKDKTTAAILALVLGGIGGHRFYLGQTGIGLLYLFFCWTFIPSFIAFVEFIIFLMMDDNAFNAKYNALYLTASRHNPIAQTQNVVVNVPNRVPQEKKQIDVVEQLEKLHRLQISGAISRQEYEEQKAKLLTVNETL